MKQTMKSCILEQPDTIRRVCQNAEKVCDSVYSIVGKGPFDNGRTFAFESKGAFL